MINPRSRKKYALERISELPWVYFGLIGGALWGTFGGLGAFRWLPEILKLIFFAPWIPKLASRRTLDSPQQRPRRPHREAEGPKKPPKPSFLHRRLSAPAQKP